MKYLKNLKLTLFLLLGLVVVFNSCKRDLSDDALLATFPKNGNVYIDGFSAGLDYLPYGDSYFEAFSVDEETKYSGTSAMRFDIPNAGDPNGAYSGAIFPDYGGRDLTDFDALTFWAKASTSATLNNVGFGQDFLENKYEVSLSNIILTTNWRQYTVAIPNPSRLTQEKGLFWYAEGPENGEGYSLWVDELKFEKLGTIAQPRPSIMEGLDVTVESFVGVGTNITPLQQTFNLEDGTDQTLDISPYYFDFFSSDTTVAQVDEGGVITALGTGTAIIAATLNGISATGSVTVNVGGAFDTAPVPTRDPADVISVFSNAYTDEPVDYFNGYWAPFQTTQGQNDVTINGDDLIYYTDLNFVGIQFADNVPTIDASQMTHFHIDVQAVDDIENGDFFKIEFVDAGPDSQLGTDDESVGSTTISSANLVSGGWYSLDIPFSDITGLTNRANLAQIIFVTDATITEAYVDNIYFYSDSDVVVVTAPQTPAPTPMQAPADVISVFSDAFNNVPGSDLNPNWGQATTVSEVPINGNNTLFYEGLNYQGLQLGTPQDIADKDFLHLDYWTTNSSDLNVYLISTGPVETPKALPVPTPSVWRSIDIPLGDFSPVDLTDLIQLKFDGNGDIYFDNIYFY